MVQGILLALSAALVYGFLGISFELAGKRGYNVWQVLFYKQLVGTMLGLACTVALGLPLWNAELCWLGLIGALSYVCTVACYLIASRERDIAANWTILNLSVVLPLLVSVVWFGDPLTATKVLGVAFTLGSIVLIGGGFQDLRRRWNDSHWLRYILGAFLFNGVLAMLFRFVPDGFGALFTFYFYGISVLLVAPPLLLGGVARPAPGLLPVAALGAATHWGGIMLTMGALSVVGRISNQAGIIVYPITNGLVIPVGVVLGVIFLRQKIARRVVLGVLTGMAGLTLLFL
jgi:multidrug transporter EmrE-like cation transporter